jgi:hypothetical protein
MNLKEVTALLGWRREEVKTAIDEGVTLPKSKKTIKLRANQIGNDYDIAESDLDNFIDAFEKEEPGRHPPVSVLRELRIEADDRCAICRKNAHLHLHHMLEFAKLGHHDPSEMLAVCGTCHDKIHKDPIDYKRQKGYKLRLKKRELFSADFPSRFSWDDLRNIITALYDGLAISNPSTESKYDFSGINIEKKNELNQLGEPYFSMMKDHHEPYFGRIERFLKDPINVEIADTYHQVVDELRSKIALKQGKADDFGTILMQIYDSAKIIPELASKRKTLNILLSFMYFQCDIGRKT